MSTGGGGRRGDVLACIRKFPGIHLRGIEREIGMSSALVHYHVKALEEEKTIVSAVVGGYLRFYPREIVTGPRGLAASDQEALALLREEAILHVVLLLLDERELAQKDIAESLALAKSTVSYHVDRLLAKGVVTRAERDGEKVVKLRDPARLRRLLTRFEPTKAMRDKFSDMWEDFYGT